ncbi:snRNA-activating protein complex subunit 4 [Dissostichus eleginoides]|uniref:snRNA-activating protein complex subunit 4 n=1 Tax=Dissostichus eleginoides TaxID=100907 RepID=A0AAD9EW72_DISEL|nr:snRNA-activating protein complex subunit 4 [Dissostichus eleginoides]
MTGKLTPVCPSTCRSLHLSVSYLSVPPPVCLSVSYFMEGRDPAQLIYSWNQVLDPSLKKGFWSKEEDELLLDAVSRHGEKDWWKIRLEVPGRTDSGCRDRCVLIGPWEAAEVKKGAFDQQETGLLLMLVHKHGVGRWARIAAEIPQRNDAQCMRTWRKMSRTIPVRPLKVTGRRAPTQKVAPTRKRARRRPVLPGGPSPPGPVDPPPPGAPPAPMVRSTLLEGPRVSSLLGPPPTERRGSSLLMVSEQQLRARLLQQIGPPSMRLSSELQEAVAPWLGNLLLRRRCSVAHSLRSSSPPSSPLFLLLLQAMRVDATGCREVIQQRSSGGVLLAPPPPSPASSPRANFVSGILQLRSIKEEQQEKLIHTQTRPRVLLQRPPQAIVPPSPLNPSLPLEGVMAAGGSQKTGGALQETQAEDGQEATPPPSVPTNQRSAPCPLPPFPVDHDYAFSVLPPCSLKPDSSTTASPRKREIQEEMSSGTGVMSHQDWTGVMSHQNGTGVMSHQDGTGVMSHQDGTGVMSHQDGTGVTPPRGKRVRNLTPRAIALQEETRAKDEARRKRRASSPRKKRSHSSKQEVVPVPPLAFYLQPMLVLTPGGLVQVAQAPPPGPQLTQALPLTKAPPPFLQLTQAPPPGPQLTQALPLTKAPPPFLQLTQAPPPGPQLTQALPLTKAPPPFLQLTQAPPPGLQLTQAPTPFLQLTQAPPPGLQLTQAPPPFLQLTQAPPPSLQLTQAPPPFLQLTQAPPLFLQLTQALPLTQAPPPFLQLTQSPPPGLQLTQAPPPRLQQTQAPPPFLQLTQASSPIIKPLPNHFLPYKGMQFDSSLMFLESQEEVRDWLSGRGGVAAPGGRGLPYLPPSVSSVRSLSALLRARRSLSYSSTKLLSRRSTPRRPPATPERGGGRLGSTPPLRDTQDAAVTRQLVAERFSGNPAYQLLKARFLSCYTVPALLASLQPITKKTVDLSCWETGLELQPITSQGSRPIQTFRTLSTETSQIKCPPRTLSTETSQLKCPRRTLSTETSQIKCPRRTLSTETSQIKCPHRTLSTETSQDSVH